MTTEEFLETNPNPWLEVADMYKTDKADCLYGENNYFCEGDRSAIENYNNKAKGTTDEIITNIPAEPWWGNPLTARLIILSLNPGYVPEVNKTLALLMQTNEAVRRQLIDYKAKTLRLQAESFLPEDEAVPGCPITCKEAVNMLGDWYWVKMLRELREDTKLCEKEFYRRIALVEYHGYSSQTSGRVFPRKKDELESQDFLKKLLWYIAENRKDNVRFLVMRSIEKWKELLNSSSPYFFENCEKAGKILCKTNKGMSQAITENNLGKEIYEKIKEVFRDESGEAKDF